MPSLRLLCTLACGLSTSLLEAAPLFPEDGSLRARSWWAASTLFTPLVNRTRLEAALEREGVETRDLRSNYEWSQDLSLFDERGRFLIQAPMPEIEEILTGLTMGIFNLSDDFPSLRRLNAGDLQSLGLAYERLEHVVVEGGEMIAGRKSDGRPYVILTKDVVERTRRFKAHLRGQDVDIREARLGVAKDLRVAETDLHVVDFGGHIDLVMQAFPGGTILIDDPRLATQTLIRARSQSNLREYEASALDRMILLHERGHLRYYSKDAPSEIRGKPMGPPTSLFSEHEITRLDLVAQELTNAGFRVIRVAGRFWDAEPGDWSPRMRSNFLNGAVGRNVKDKIFVLSNSARGLDSLEDDWRRTLAVLDVAPEHVHFPGYSDSTSGFDCIGSLAP